MATNKHATIRYHVLDKCFSNFGRMYFIEDLIEACNDALFEYAGIEDGVKRRQIFDDMTFMESEQGWSIPLLRPWFGHRKYYRYEDKNFSIKNQRITDNEIAQIRDSLSIISRFKGMPQFEWVEETIARLETAFKIKGLDTAFINFEHNPYLKGLQYFSVLINAIQNKRVLNINYKGFRQEKEVEYILHPYYLKQYNNRWFLFGQNPKHSSITNLALDRIQNINETTIAYIENLDVDFEDFFEDIVGVTIPPNAEPQNVLIKVSRDLWPYIESKPLHGSQKIKEKTEDFVIIELFVIINFELISLFFSHANGITIIDPKSLADILKEKANLLIKNYL